MDTSLTVNCLIKGLSWYFPPVNPLLKKRAMRRYMKKTCSLNVGRYAARLIDLNEYLAFFPGATVAEKLVLLN